MGEVVAKELGFQTLNIQGLKITMVGTEKLICMLLSV